MSIRAVFRVQCDGPCRGWLSTPECYRMGTDIRPEAFVVAPTAERAGNWPGERAARRAALGAGWTYTGVSAWNPEGQHATARGGTLLCPKCKTNPLGISLPSNGRCEATSPSGFIRCDRDVGHAQAHTYGVIDWF